MRPKLLVLVVVSALALVGCAASEEPEIAKVDSSDISTSTPSESTSETVEVSTVKPKALKIESTPSDSVANDPVKIQANKSYEEQTSDFISFINPEFSGWSGELPPEADLIAAAKLVCEQLKDGVSFERVEAIKGSVYKFTKEQEESLSMSQKLALLETPLYENNRKLVNAASSAYCLEYRS